MDVDPFWPTTANQWLGFLVAAFMAAASVVGLFYKIGRLQANYEQSFKEQGKRIGDVETSCGSNQALFQELKAQQTAQSFQIAGIEKDHGRLEGMMQSLNENAAAATESNVQIRIQLGKMETQMDIFGEIRELLSLLIKSQTK